MTYSPSAAIWDAFDKLEPSGNELPMTGDAIFGRVAKHLYELTNPNSTRDDRLKALEKAGGQIIYELFEQYSRG